MDAEYKIKYKENNGATTPEPKTPKYSPPYKRIRALRLFNDSSTNSSKVNKSLNCSTSLISKFVSSSPIADSTALNSHFKPHVNINPFSPDSVQLSRKRLHSTCSTSVCDSPEFNHSSKSLDLDDMDVSEYDSEHNSSKRILRESNISRYNEEFHNVELIGTGQFASVFKCINRLDGCLYAIKKSTRPVIDGVFEKLALNEVYAHAVLGKHPNVVRYYSAWVENDHMIIQNEYCNGGSLAEKLTAGMLEVCELKKLLRQIAEGLRYIHSEGLAHLDIKPSNIFISRERRCHSSFDDSSDESFEELNESQTEEDEVYKIGDLGHVTSISNTKVEEGDCRYLSYEILQETYTHLPLADIFALGMSVLEAAGFHPLPKNGEEWHNIRNGVLPTLPQRLPAELLELIQAMIVKEPSKRPTAFQILQHRALQPDGCKSRAQLHRELNEEKLKNEILSKQVLAAAQCITNIVPDSKQMKTVNKSRLVGRKETRSYSTTNF